jgi:hypothetical protein
MLKRLKKKRLIPNKRKKLKQIALSISLKMQTRKAKLSKYTLPTSTYQIPESIK